MSLRGGALDLLNIPRWAFSDRKMALHAPGAFAAVAFIWAVAQFWEPFTPAKTALVCAAAALAAMPGSAASARLTILQLEGDFFAEAKPAPWPTLKAALAPLAVLTLIPAALLGLAYLGGALGRLLGSWWTGLGTLLLIPGLFVGLLLVFSLFIWAVGLLLLPAAAGVSGERGIETSYQLTSIAWSQGWRVLFYEAATLLMSALSAAVFAGASFAGLFLLTMAASLGSPELDDVAKASVALFGSFFSLSAPQAPLELPLQIGVWIGASVLILTLWASVSYLFSGVSVGNAIIYIDLRQRIWGDNVLMKSSMKGEAKGEVEQC